MAVDRIRLLPTVVGPALLIMSVACQGTIDSAVPGGWDGTQAAASDPSLPPRSPNGIPQQAAAKPGAPGSPTAPGGSNIPGAGPGATSPGGTTAQDCSQPTVGQSPLRRLTHEEYDNSVRDLLGDTTGPAKDFATDTLVGLFDNTASTQTVPELLADQYLDSAVTLAGGISDVKMVTGGCDPAASGTTGTNCVKTFITKFGRRAFRRPLEADEVTRLTTVFSTAKSAEDATTGVKAVVSAVLSSPNFLFKPEFGAQTAIGGSAMLGAQQAAQFEIAGRLASLIWASVPDDMLLDAAQRNELKTKDQIGMQAQRMVADARAKPAVADFYKQWFGLARIETTTKDTTTYPTFDDTLKASMSEESRQFIDEVVWNGDSKLDTMLSANWSFLNKPLADLYGVKQGAPADAMTFQKVNLDPQQRAGILTQASVLAAYARPDQSSPVKRGQWVRVRMLCQDLPDPPANVPQLPEPKQGISNRERFAMHTSNPACSGCHSLIDGLGFGLEAYDGIGAWRTMDQGVAVDASGEITSTQDIDGKYSGGTELAGLLAGSSQVRDCAPTQLLRYSLGRRDEPEDACSLLEVQSAFADSNGDLKELVVALTQTDAFSMYRKPE